MLRLNVLLFTAFCVCFLSTCTAQAESTTPISENSSANRCNGSKAFQLYQEGIGLFWCRGNGEPLALACFAPNGNRVDVGSSFWTETSILVCNANGTMSWSYDACLVEGERMEVGSKLRHGFYIYECTRRENGHLKLDITGCFANHTGEKEVETNLGSPLTVDGIVYTCAINASLTPPGMIVNGTTVVSQMTKNPVPGEVPAPPPGQELPTDSPGEETPSLTVGNGCKFNGKKYKLNEDFVALNSIWYMCTNESITPVIYGCAYKNKTYRTGELFNDTSKLIGFKCENTGGGPFPTPVPVKCLEKYSNGSILQFDPGQKWLADNGTSVNNAYVMKCVQNGIEVERRSLGCYYHTDAGEGVLEDSCMKSVGLVTIQCWPLLKGVTANNRIKITTNPPSEKAKARFKLGGIKECDSKTLAEVLAS